MRRDGFEIFVECDAAQNADFFPQNKTSNVHLDPKVNCKVNIAFARNTEVEFEQRRKRRRLHREASVSPVRVVEETVINGKIGSEPVVMARPGYTGGDQNHSSDYKYKARFFRFLGLEPVSSEDRKSMVQAHKIVSLIGCLICIRWCLGELQILVHGWSSVLGKYSCESRLE